MSPSELHPDLRAAAVFRRLAALLVAEERELALDLIAALHTIAGLPSGYEPRIDRLQSFQAALRHAVADDRAADSG